MRKSQEPITCSAAKAHRHILDPQEVRLRQLLAQDMVSVVVRLSRCLYAQLAQQAFQPPRGYPPLPPPDSRQHGAASLGMKLTCALEMLHARAAGHVSAVPDQVGVRACLTTVASSPTAT